jgi:aspartate racemase
MNGWLGVLGGMGPLATADFLQKLTRNSAAGIDQEHVPVLMYGDCRIPDRTQAIVGQGPSPRDALLKGVRFLTEAGVSAICIPCNSAHHWFDEMQAETSVPIIHIAKATVHHIRKTNGIARKVGVMSTLGTYRTGIYRDQLERAGYEVMVPTDEEFDSHVSPGIALVKANRIAHAETLFDEIASRLLSRGAEVIVLGCTEIPLGMQSHVSGQPAVFVDSSDALALAAIDFLQGKSAADGL